MGAIVWEFTEQTSLDLHCNFSLDSARATEAVSQAHVDVRVLGERVLSWELQLVLPVVRGEPAHAGRALLAPGGDAGKRRAEALLAMLPFLALHCGWGLVLIPVPGARSAEDTCRRDLESFLEPRGALPAWQGKISPVSTGTRCRGPQGTG